MVVFCPLTCPQSAEFPLATRESPGSSESALPSHSYTIIVSVPVLSHLNCPRASSLVLGGSLKGRQVLTGRLARPTRLLGLYVFVHISVYVHVYMLLLYVLSLRG